MAYFIIKRHCEHKNTGLRPAPVSTSHLLQHHADPLQTLYLLRTQTIQASYLTQNRKLFYCCSKNSSGSRTLAFHRDYTYQETSTSLIITPTNINYFQRLQKYNSLSIYVGTSCKPSSSFITVSERRRFSNLSDSS